MPELNPRYIVDTVAMRADNHLVLALSGGLDSMVLLHLLAQARQLQPFTLNAVYIHHGISRHADSWAEFCAAQCAMLQVGFATRKVNISGPDNLEHKAREARYQALAECISTDKHMLLTAHHGDDQLESLLLALKRGAGPAGLSGIARQRSFAAGVMLRPLLEFNRQELEHYARQHQLQWIEDDSNSNMRFDRNFIRHQLTPVLRQRWPHFARTAARSMQHLAQLQQLADYHTDNALQLCQRGNRILLPELTTFVPLQQDLVLRRWLHGYGLNPETQWLETLKRDVINAREDASPVLVLAQYQLRRFANTLYLLTEADVQQPAATLYWQAEASIMLPSGCGWLNFSARQSDGAVALSVSSGQWDFGKLSLRFKPAGASMSKPLKQWFKLWQVPPWERQRVPLLIIDGQVAAVAGYASNTPPEHASWWCSWQQEP